MQQVCLMANQFVQMNHIMEQKDANILRYSSPTLGLIQLCNLFAPQPFCKLESSLISSAQPKWAALRFLLNVEFYQAYRLDKFRKVSIKCMHCRGGGMCSRLGAQRISEAKTLGVQNHHFIYYQPKYWLRKCAPSSTAPGAYILGVCIFFAADVTATL